MATEFPSTNHKILGDRYTEKVSYAFPEAAPPYLPLGKMITVQLRTPGDYKVLGNGEKLFFSDESKDHEKYNVQTALVRCLGPLAYKNRLNATPFPEGDWVKPGDFVRVPKYGGDRVGVAVEGGREAFFLTVNDTDVLGLIYSDPLAIKAIL